MQRAQSEKEICVWNLSDFEDTGSNSDSIELPSLKIWIFEYFENIYIWNQKNNKHPITHILHSTISSIILKVTYCARIDFRSTLSSSWKFALQTSVVRHTNIWSSTHRKLGNKCKGLKMAKEGNRWKIQTIFTTFLQLYLIVLKNRLI